jgi:diguanylate cyclase (GGDEF)-like protein
MADPTEEVAVEAAPESGVASIYAPYGQLTKMLLPRAGGIAFYDSNEELLWCSDGCERPDLKEVLRSLPTDDTARLSTGGAIRALSGDGLAFVYALRSQEKEHLGTLVVELGEGPRRHTTGSMVASLLRPVLDCLENRVDAEAAKAATPPPPPMPAPRLDETQTMQLQLLVGADETSEGQAGGLEHLVQQCVDHLGCALGALLIPDRNLTISCVAEGVTSANGENTLSRAQKHLLAWIQLHDKPMVVNRVAPGAAAKNVSPYKILSCPLHDANGRVIGLFGLFRPVDAPDFESQDVSLLELMSRKAIKLLNHRYDALTGLPNRFAFEQDADRVLKTVNRGQRQAALLYVDIDGLNHVNCAFGFHSGDEIIQRLAVVIQKYGESGHIVGRLGGDRFVVLLPPDCPEDPEELAERLRAEMSQLTYLQGDRAMPVSVSIGIGRSSGSNDTVAHVIAAAEYACKRAKELGRNRVEVSHADNAFSIANRNDAFAFASLQNALKANQFGLEIQPVHRLEGEPGVLGHEVLMRMRDGESYVGPDKFLAAAERYHLMPALDRWVIVATLRSLKGPAASLLRTGWVSINVSAQSFQSDSFREFLVTQLSASGLPLESLCIELRESSAAHNMREAEALIRSLHELGVKVALDDFGRGLSSLAYLRTLPVEYIKIDGDLVRRVATDKLAESMVLGIAQAATTLGIEAVAEHVETEEVLARLRELHVSCGQGYYLARPEPMPSVYEQAATAQRSAS